MNRAGGKVGKRVGGKALPPLLPYAEWVALGPEKAAEYLARRHHWSAQRQGKLWAILDFCWKEEKTPVETMRIPTLHELAALAKDHPPLPLSALNHQPSHRRVALPRKNNSQIQTEIPVAVSATHIIVLDARPFMEPDRSRTVHWVYEGPVDLSARP